jgi:hypothetical protein
MSTETKVTQYRGGDPIKRNILVRIDQNNDRVSSYSAGAQPYFSHWIYTINSVFDVQNKDLLKDQNPDISGNYNEYRVAGKPETFELDHVEIPCNLAE